MFISDISRNLRTTTTGLIAGTLVEGAQGWMPVENLRIGDAVHSYDGGLVRVLGLDRNWITPAANAYTLRLPGGAMDNCSDLLLLPRQNLLIDTLNCVDYPDDLMVLMPALALEGMFGTTRMRIEKPIEVITPRFADDEAIFANSGILLHCPNITDTASQPASGFFTQFDLAQVQRFLRATTRAFSVHSLCFAA